MGSNHFTANLLLIRPVKELGHVWRRQNHVNTKYYSGKLLHIASPLKAKLLGPDYALWAAECIRSMQTATVDDLQPSPRDR